MNNDHAPPICLNVRRFSVLLIALAMAAGCTATSDQTDETAPVAAPAEQIEFDEQRLLATTGPAQLFVGTSYGVDADSIEMETVEVPEEVAARTAGALSQGVAIESDVDFDGFMHLTLTLPPAPSEDSIPAVLHLDDDGQIVVVPGVLNSNNTITVRVNDFSSFFSGWWNPANWIEEVLRGIGGGIDFISDWVTGRTDPPACRNDAPSWASLSVAEASSLHVCLQSNPTEDGTERVEIYIKSNRSTMQFVTLPTGADYIWVQGQSEWLRPLLRDALSDGGQPQGVVLFGGQSMSVGYTRPVAGAEFALRSYQTNTQIIANHLLGVLGGLDGEGAQVAALVVFACLGEQSGIDLPSWGGAPDSFEAAGEGIVKCAVGLLTNPELAGDVVAEVLGSAGADSEAVEQARNFVSRNVAGGIAKNAQRLLAAFNVGGAVTRVWDGIFDSVAEGSIVFSVQPEPVTPPPTAQPAPQPQQAPPPGNEQIQAVGAITLDMTCLEYLAFSNDERGSAVRVFGVQAGWNEAGSPFGILNFDSHCGQRPNQTLRTAFDLFAN